MSTVENQLLESRDRFLAYIRVRISDPDLAEDILQDSLLKALQSAPGLRDEERLVPWFYRILHNAIIDVYRRRQVENRAIESLKIGVSYPDPEDEAAICQCFHGLIPSLKTEYAELIQAELAGANWDSMANDQGITANNLKVRRHRARQSLRKRLEETCRTCAEHGCLDCDCR